MENGEDNIERVMGFRYGRINQDMKVNGLWIKPMGLASYFMLMEMYMKGLGKMIKLMEEVFISIRMGQHMRENG